MEAWDPPKITIFSKEAFYGFLKDVRNKTLTFEVRIHTKMETESYEKEFKLEVSQKIEKSAKI